MSLRIRPAIASAALVLLSACGRAVVADNADQTDPVLAAGLAAPLMTDPDLATANREGAALSADSTTGVQVPLDKVSDKARDAAKDEAMAWLGRSPGPVPAPASGQGPAIGISVLQSWQSVFGSGSCADQAEWGHVWAARMPQAFPVYPRGHVQEAVGNDQGGCRLRAINFQTPVAVADIIAFYYGAAKKAGLGTEHRAHGDEEALIGRNRASGLAVFARPGAGGMTEVDLVTSGF